MLKKIKLKINGKSVACEPGCTIMEAAAQAGIEIPGLCGHPDFCYKSTCRVCVVEIKDRKNLATACSFPVADGMEVVTDSERVKKARNVNLELIFAEHIEKCEDCIWRFECRLLKYARDYKLKLTKFQDRKGKRETFRFANAVEIDGTQCIDCRNCIDACSQLQKLDILELKGKGPSQEVVPSSDKKKKCILCGQCTVHCPVSSAQEQAQWREVEKAIADKDKIVIAQFAPSIRVSIGEDFGLPHGKIMTGQVVSGLRALGFDHVFDVNFGADVTTIVEAKELIERLTDAKAGKKVSLPMITSCCPGWVNYVELYCPDLIPNLTTARSPQIHNGGLVKTFWANRLKIDPAQIVVVSIMPCTAKKYEASRTELKINKDLPVDYVLTTREFSFLLKKNGIDFAKLKKGEAENPLGVYSGGGAIFGSSGGVMESALRSAHAMLCGDKKTGICRARIDFKAVRGLEGLKEAEVEVAGLKLRVAIVNGIGNIKGALERLEDYDYMEVMACPGGCIGGGGQPIPTTNEIRQKRMAALYELDKKCEIRISSENVGANEALDWVKAQGHEFEHKVLHTGYKKKDKY